MSKTSDLLALLGELKVDEIDQEITNLLANLERLRRVRLLVTGESGATAPPPAPAPPTTNGEAKQQSWRQPNPENLALRRRLAYLLVEHGPLGPSDLGVHAGLDGKTVSNNLRNMSAWFESVGGGRWDVTEEGRQAASGVATPDNPLSPPTPQATPRTSEQVLEERRKIARLIHQYGPLSPVRIRELSGLSKDDVNNRLSPHKSDWFVAGADHRYSLSPTGLAAIGASQPPATDQVPAPDEDEDDDSDLDEDDEVPDVRTPLELRTAIVECIAKFGPMKAHPLSLSVEAHGHKCVELMEEHRWFTQEGDGRWNITQRARQEALPQKEDD